MAPPVKTVYREGQYSTEPAPFDFAAAQAPGGEPWSDFIQKAYEGIQGNQGYADYATYWNPLIRAFGGSDLGYNPETGMRTRQAAPEFQHAVAQLPEDIRFQANENLQAQGREDDMNIFGDQFFQALAALGAATGGAALFGGFGAGGAFPAAAAADPFALGGPAGGVTGTGAGLGPTAAAALPAAATTGTVGAVVPAATTGGFMGGGGWGSLLGPLISGGTSLIGGAMASNAAKNAAQTQAGAANDANRLLWEIYQQNRADQTPYREIGTAALGGLAGQAANPFTAEGYTAPAAFTPGGYGFDPSQYNFDPSSYSFAPPNEALNPADFAFTPPVQPINPGNYAFTAPTEADMNQDPGYRFRLSQGMKALEGGAAARGGLLSGGTAMGAQRFGQDLASQEYGNVYNRALGQNQLRFGRDVAANEQAYTRGLGENRLGFERAQYGNETAYNRSLAQNQMNFERGLTGNQLGYTRDLAANQLRYGRDYQANQDVYGRSRDEYLTNLGLQKDIRNTRWNELASLAGVGQTATNQTGAYGSNYGNAAAGNITSAGAAQAAGDIGASNAWMGALGGVGSAANSYMNNALMRQQLAQQQQQQQQFMDILRQRR